VIVVKGPGSFTGLRIGVTVANTIAYLNKCPIFGIDTCEYLWASLEDSDSEISKLESLALLIFAGSKGVYVSQNLETATKATLVNLPDLNGYLKEHKIIKFFGDISKEQKKTLEEFEYLEIKKSFGEIIQKVIAKIDSGMLKPVPIVEPIYVKKPAITESKKNIFA
jgi:tRNA A37 threonylcarbamoyladenosine modification protein TsaB